MDASVFYDATPEAQLAVACVEHLARNAGGWLRLFTGGIHAVLTCLALALASRAMRNICEGVAAITNRNRE